MAVWAVMKRLGREGYRKIVAKCMRRIKDMRDAGTTILFVSHDITSVRTLCDRVIWLHDGRVVEDGSVFPITGRYLKHMLGDSRLGELEAGGAATSEGRGEEVEPGRVAEAEPVE